MIPFCKTIWGDNIEGSRRKKIDNDIKFTLAQKYQLNEIIYCYGIENQSMMIDYGFKTRLICDESRMFPKESEFGHKLYAWKMMAEDYKMFTYLDHDVALTSKIPKDYYSKLKAKSLQVSLRMYHNKKARWRKEHQRKIPCASWLWIGDNNIPSILYSNWVDMGMPWREELVLARYTESTPKNLDLDYYWNIFEPEYFWLKNEGYFKTKHVGQSLFKHYNTAEIRSWYKKNK